MSTRAAAEVLAGPREPLPSFRVAVVGAPAWAADTELLARLLLSLTARHRGTRQIVLVSLGRGGPELLWCHDLWWSLELMAGFGTGGERDRAVSQWADALVVLGASHPWRRLVALFEAAGKPVRVHATAPRVPPLLSFRKEWDADLGRDFEGGLRAG